MGGEIPGLKKALLCLTFLILYTYGGMGSTAQGEIVGQWKYEQAHIFGSTVEDISGNNKHGSIVGGINLNPNPEALILSGSNNYVSVNNGPLPSRDITLEAWVTVDQPVSWAGIVNYIQDNGSTEHGWILGQNNGAFMFGLSSGSLTYLHASENFELNQWYHVVGVYDGSEMKIYINGEPKGSSTAQSGNISYLASWFCMGTYKDDNEYYYWDGMIAEVVVHDEALSLSEVQSRFEARRGEFGYVEIAELKTGPYVHFAKKAEVTVHWKTETAVPSIIEYGANFQLTAQVQQATPKTDHALTITGLTTDTEYSYRIILGDDPTEIFKFYSTFDYGPEPFPGGDSPYPVDSLTTLYEQAAEYIINNSGITKGVCIDYGCGRGHLAYEISKRSDLKVIGFGENAGDITTARNYLDKAGLYGSRVTIFFANLAELKCRDYSANLIVSDRMIADGICPGTAAEVFRVLRPNGGKAYLGQPSSCPNPLSQVTLENWLSGISYTLDHTNGLWAVIDRGSLNGAGEWTHFYADLANTANSGDTRIQNNMKMLWYGQPGPRYVIDRHNRPMTSLYKDGTVVTPGVERIMAYDAYNGSRYWDVSIPELSRVAVLRDCGWMALANDYVYVAHKQNCVGLDIKTGMPIIHLEAPQLIGGQIRNWGFLGVEGNRIYGSGQKEGASLIGHSLGNVYLAYYDNKPVATSDYLFCLDRHSGSSLWTYKRASGSVIINSAIVVGGNYIYFIESRNSTAINDSDGRVLSSVLMSGSNEYLVKLNKATGVQQWAVPVDLPFEHTTYLSYCQAEDLLVAVGSHNDPGAKYEHRAYYASNGSLKWSSNYNQGSIGGGHGEQDQHPVIVGSMMYSRYYKIDLGSPGGTVTSFPLSRGNCGTQSACATHLFGRNGNPYMYELPNGNSIRVTADTRPGCWVNMIPAGGLLLIPESSAGCTCDYPIQASMSFVPE